MKSFFQDSSLKELELLINHRAGLPAWGLLSRCDWMDQIKSYEITASATEYSDFSALRYMLEVEQKLGIHYEDLVYKNLDYRIRFWMDIDYLTQTVLQNGYYQQKPNIGAVHDPNSYNLCEFTSHAGLFGDN